MPLLVKVFSGYSMQRVVLYFCLVYCSYLSTEGGWLFMSFGHPRGLPKAVRSRDTWRVCGPSSSR
jgi:hypothetical protein